MKYPPSTCFRRAALAGVAAALALVPAGQLSAQRSTGIPANPDTKTIVHVLNRLGFGPRPGDVERVRDVGLAAYIEAQLHPRQVPDESLEARLSSMPTLALSSETLYDEYSRPADELRRRQLQAQRQAQANPDPAMSPQPPPQMAPEQRQIRQRAQSVTNELMQAKMLRAVLTERQLEEVLVDFWFNHFNVFLGKGQVRLYLTEYEREAIRPHVLGRFRDMLGASARSPAMLFYLDNFQSRAEYASLVVRPDMDRRLRNPRLSEQQRQQMLQRMQMQQRRRPGGLNENYARELMELHTLGVDGGYAQEDVVAVARVFTGWTIDRPRQGGRFVFRPEMHDADEKIVLGHRFASGGGQEEGERVLDLLAAHPSTARHIAFKLAQRFIADEPPDALVDRAAAVFAETKGDLREVTRAIITSPEFFAEAAYRAKVKTPLEFIASALRATGASVANAQPLVAAMAGLGMPLYGAQPPTGYSMTADAWVNTGALLARMNLAVQLISGTAPARQGRGTRARQPQQPPGGRGRASARPGRQMIRVDLASIAPDTSADTRATLIATMLAGDVSDATRQTLARAETPAQLLALTLGSPEFQRR